MTGQERSRLANEMRRETADLLTIEHVEHPQLLHHLLAKAVQRDVHELAAVLLRQLPPAGPGRGVA